MRHHPESAKRAKPLLVAITGGSGAGKSWVAEKLQALLGDDAARLSLDDFYLDRSHLPPGRRCRVNFDHPRAIDWACVERVLRGFAAGHPARVPCYDFKTHCRLPSCRTFQPKPVIIMDGLWLLRRPLLRRLFDLSVFLECPAKTRLRRRLARDLVCRGRTRASILEQFWGTVEPMHGKFVAPQARWAHVVLKRGCGDDDIAKLRDQLKAKRRTDLGRKRWYEDGNR